MSPYYNQTDPTEMAQLSGNPFYNPLQPGPDFVRGIQALYANLQGAKDKKKSEQQADEDRKWKQLLMQAQIGNLNEPNRIPPEPKPTSEVSPLMVKSMMKRLDYPDEVIAEVDTMNKPALAAAWAKTQQDFASRQQAGMRIPRTATSTKGRLQLQRLKYALDTVKSRKAVPTAALSQLLANPDKAMISSAQIDKLQSQLADTEAQEGEIALMMQNVDENGELSVEQERDLDLILKQKKSYGTIQKNYNKTFPATLTKTARSSSGREISVHSNDGGKTWLDDKGNIIPIGK